MLLNNKNAIIYGGAGSIGSAVARAFAREGARVFLAGRTLEDLDKVASEISAAGGRASTAAVDAFDAEAVERHADAVIKAAGSIDASFNAINITDSVQGTALIELSPDQISQPVKDRLTTNLITARAAARHMIRNGTGAILMITATPARMAFPCTGSFGVEGAAIEGLCRSLASELGPKGIRVVCLRSAGSPESFPNAASSKHAVGKSRDDIAAQLTELTLLKRTPKLDEIGNVAAFAASEYATPMTATVLNISCGTIAD
jgi:3-oxoacyl-[acyl-carrier protein] reductase